MRLSIVVNMYNTAKYLPKCMYSLLNQDIYTNEYEIILVDDGSTDDTITIANNYVNRYSNVKLFVHEKNLGLPSARNTGIHNSCGEYLCFVDADDYIEANSLMSLLNIMKKHKLDILRFDYQKVDEKGYLIPHNRAELKFDYSAGIMSGIEFLTSRMGVQCYVWPYIFRTSLIKDNKIFFVKECYFDDVLWTPRVLLVAKRVECVSVKHTFYLQRGGSMVRAISTQSIKTRTNGQIKLLEILKEQMKSVPLEATDWYKKIWSFTAFCIIDSVLKLPQSDAYAIIDLLHELQAFPLKLEAYNKYNMIIKEIFINISPKMYWSLFHH